MRVQTTHNWWCKQTLWYSMYMASMHAWTAVAEGLPIYKIIYLHQRHLDCPCARTPGLYINIRMVITPSWQLNTVPRLLHSSPRPIIMPMRKGRVRFLVCAVLLAASLAVYYYTAVAGKGSMVTTLERLRNAASSHARGSTRAGDKSVDAHVEDGGASSIHISVKTTAKYHDDRLVVMMLTWMRTVPDPAQVSTRTGK